MKIKKGFLLKDSGSKTIFVDYTPISECPNCKKALAPQNLFGIVHEKDNDKKVLSVADYCNGCNTLIVSEFDIKKQEIIGHNGTRSFSDDKYEMIKLNHSSPINFKEREFDKNLSTLSSQFIKIYNQAKKAEELGLDEIAGLGYRKSLEFLVKDYAIYKNTEKEEIIKNTWMSDCIKTYIDNEQIKTLAEKSEWIGNDEAHYVRKQEDRDINDMKRFIDAMTYFISMSLIVDDASTMQSKKTKEKSED